jgi:hypothetical protein
LVIFLIIPIDIIYCIYLFIKFLINKLKWEKILKEHNNIKPKKWLVNTKNAKYEN